MPYRIHDERVIFYFSGCIGKINTILTSGVFNVPLVSDSTHPRRYVEAPLSDGWASSLCLIQGDVIINFDVTVCNLFGMSQGMYRNV